MRAARSSSKPICSTRCKSDFLLSYCFAMSEPLRLSKRMSELGLCSRREADEWIANGWVRVDGVVVSELGTKILQTQKVTVERQAAAQQAKRVTVLLNKPVGYVSGQAE